MTANDVQHDLNLLQWERTTRINNLIATPPGRYRDYLVTCLSQCEQEIKVKTSYVKVLAYCNG